MYLIDYLRMVVRQWVILVALLVVGGGAGLAWGYTATPQYRATSVLIVGNVLSAKESGQAAQAQQFTLDRMQTYAALATSPQVSEAVIRDLGLDMTVGGLSARTTASAPPRTVLLRVTVQDASPTKAADIANATARELGKTIESLEKPVDASASLVRVSFPGLATPPGAPSSPNKKLALLLGLIVGGGLGLLGAYIRDDHGRRKATAADPRRAGARVAGPARGLDVPAPGQSFMRTFDGPPPAPMSEAGSR